MTNTELTDLQLTLGQIAVPVMTKDFGGREVEGRLHSATLTTPGGVSVNLTYRADAEGGSGELSCVEVFAGSPELEGIRNRLRIGVQPTRAGTSFAQMRMAAFPRRGERPTARVVSIDDLDKRCGGDVSRFLLSKGVLRVGTREQLFAETNRTRGELAAEVSGNDAVEALLWVFTVTRVLPLARQIEDGI